MKSTTTLELNLAIAKIVYEGKNVKIERIKEYVVYTNALSTRPSYLDYCNDWNDLMPLVTEYLAHHLTCRLDGDGVYTVYTMRMAKSFKATNKNLQRALAELLLKTLQEKEK